VVSKDKVAKEFRIENLKKILKSGIDEKLQSALELTKCTALEHHEKMQGASGSSSSSRSGSSSDDPA